MWFVVQLLAASCLWFSAWRIIFAEYGTSILSTQSMYSRQYVYVSTGLPLYTIPGKYHGFTLKVLKGHSHQLSSCFSHLAYYSQRYREKSC